MAAPPAGGEQAYIDLITAAGPLATRNITHSPEVFDGATSYPIGTAADASAIATAGEFALEGIVAVDSLASDGTIIGSWAVTDKSILLWFDAGGSANFRGIFSDNGSYNRGATEDTSGDYTVTAATEFHVAYTHDGVTSKIYVNGVLRDSVSSAFGVSDPVAALFVGDDGTESRYLTGTGRGFAIYDRALSAAEVAAHHTAAFDFDVAGGNPAGQASRSFDGNDYIDTNSETIAGGLFAEAGNPFSVSVWIKSVGGNTVTTACARGGTTTNPTDATFAIYSTSADADMRVTIRGNRTAGLIPNELNSDTWQHVSVVWTGAGTTAQVYHNGAFVADVTIGSDAELVGKNVLIGKHDDGAVNTRGANFADVRFYNRALSSGEIQDLYNGEHITNGLEAHYLGNEDNVLDLTGNGNDATNVGSTFVADDGPFPEFDSDAQTYFSAIATAGSTISDTNKAAVNAFVVGCKADGIWSAINVFCFLAGPDDLTGALIPLVGRAPTNVGMPTGNYDRIAGILGVGSTSNYINTNYNNNESAQDDMHLFTYKHTDPISTGSQGFIGTARSVVGSSMIRRSGGSTYQFTSNAQSVTSYSGNSLGGLGVSRASSTVVQVCNGGVVSSRTLSSETPYNQLYQVFGGPGATNAVLSCYSIGSSIDLALLSARMDTYMSSII